MFRERGYHRTMKKRWGDRKDGVLLRQVINVIDDLDFSDYEESHAFGEIYETILKLKDLDECCRFFEDLCTPTELQAMEQRFDVAVYLQQGLVYLDILEKTGASSATISRVRRSMLENGAGGVMQDIIIREGLDQPK